MNYILNIIHVNYFFIRTSPRLPFFFLKWVKCWMTAARDYFYEVELWKFIASWNRTGKKNKRSCWKAPPLVVRECGERNLFVQKQKGLDLQSDKDTSPTNPQSLAHAPSSERKSRCWSSGIGKKNCSKFREKAWKIFWPKIRIFRRNFFSLEILF